MNQQLFLEWQEKARLGKDDYVVSLVQQIISAASADGVSDLHFQPEKNCMAIWYRYNGVLHELGEVPSEYTNQMVARLKVLANLLTYRTTMPQEGRVQAGKVIGNVREMRVSSMPTLYGERVVIRFFSAEEKYQFPDQLGFSSILEDDLMEALARNGGAIIISGSAGSGKTTTAYSLLRHLALHSEGLRSIITLEDPIEHPIPHISQIEVGQQGEIPLSDMIKYTLRQDPEVLFVGEIRDQSSAISALQAALSGHLLLTTFHAGSATEAVGRLSEMGIEPFILRSSIHFILCQRLLRRLCTCAQECSEPLSMSLNGQKYELEHYYVPVGCVHCSQTGYYDRVVVAESIPWNNPVVSRSVLDRLDSVSLQNIVLEAGMKTIAENAIELVRQGITSPMEVQRVLGGKTYHG